MYSNNCVQYISDINLYGVNFAQHSAETIIINTLPGKTFDYIILLLFVQARETRYNTIVVDFILLKNH